MIRTAKNSTKVSRASKILTRLSMTFFRQKPVKGIKLYAVSDLQGNLIDANLQAKDLLNFAREQKEDFELNLH